ncbi:fluoride efflux transporter FluC [Cohnella nanjingensis]|uniref:Fluoride-specific ion channel FluC n=1 Tax=Cohnella nanjingensis TaxID=1387779 RepID=A0A7X0VEU3_9BACL|nr:CrcB family protein [Cohnella nanjingensis]MBB6671111.1 CrcB family protein [Cohnella nanjingensis]
MGATIAVAVAGFFGAAARYGLTLLLPDGGGAGWPWATLFINLSGSFLLGLLLGYAMRRPLAAWLREAAGTGFLGAFTTFSAFNAQLWGMVQHQAYLSAAVYAAASGLVGWGLAALGLSWGRGRQT